MPPGISPWISCKIPLSVWTSDLNSNSYIHLLGVCPFSNAWKEYLLDTVSAPGGWCLSSGTHTIFLTYHIHWSGRTWLLPLVQATGTALLDYGNNLWVDSCFRTQHPLRVAKKTGQSCGDVSGGSPAAGRSPAGGEGRTWRPHKRSSERPD